MTDFLDNAETDRHLIESTPVPIWRKHAHYKIEVDETQDDKAKEILLCSLARPHMRAFHCSWWSFFIAFFIWFAVLPLLPFMKEDLGLTKYEIWTSSIAGVGSTILVRFIIGPLCDVYGARVLFSFVLCLISIPTACLGFVQSARGLIIMRIFIGFAGSTFVTCEYWCSRMFTKEIVGSANGLAAGWGNLGAGITNLVIGSILMPIFTAIYGGDTSKAWRTIPVIPALVAFITGIVVYRVSDDAPKGNYVELKRHRQFPSVTAVSSFRQGAGNWNSWIMFVQYACCFGVELTMNSAAALYFADMFGQSTEAAAAIAGVFGWFDLFARGLGGILSDWANSRWGMRGRLWAQTIGLLAEGIMILVFSHAKTLAGSLVALVIFSICVKATLGFNLAIVPYVDPRNMGTVIGITGAGGNVGAVCFGLAFRELNYHIAFLIMGCTVLGSSVLSIFVNIEGYACLFWGRDRLVDRETGELIHSKDASGSLPSRQRERLSNAPPPWVDSS